MATAEVSYGSALGNGRVRIDVKCSECDYRVITSGNRGDAWSHVIDDHLRQHDPGRALNIEVYWELSAQCSVCDDGGDIEQEDDGLTCRTCGTRWDIDGRYGERAEAGER